MIVVVKSVRRHKIGIVCSQLFGAIVHHIGKIFHSPRKLVCNRHRAVVSALKHETVEQFFQCQLFLRSEINGRTLDAARLGTHLYRFVKLAAFYRYKRSHDFGAACHRHFSVGITRKQNPARTCLHEHRAFCRGSRAVCVRLRHV